MNELRKILIHSFSSVLIIFFGSACSSGGGGGGFGVCPATNQSLAVCDPDQGPFSLVIDNAFFPLLVNGKSVLESADGSVQLEISVLDETEMVAGVTTRVVEEKESEGGQLIEVSRNFFAQAPDGTLCYFGETVDNYQNGMIVNNDGSWRADGAGNAPGIFMPASPSVGMSYSQESAPGIAEDQAQVLSMGDSITVPAGTFTDTLTTEDCNPLDGSMDTKIFVRGIGLAVDAEFELVSF